MGQIVSNIVNCFVTICWFSIDPSLVSTNFRIITRGNDHPEVATINRIKVVNLHQLFCCTSDMQLLVTTKADVRGMSAYSADQKF